MQPFLVTQPVAPSSQGDQRRAERFGVGLPCTVDGRQVQTSDLSATGLSFESETPSAVGDVVRMTLRYALDGHDFPLPCEVEVVRVEFVDGHYKMGARLLRPFFDASE